MRAKPLLLPLALLPIAGLVPAAGAARAADARQELLLRINQERERVGSPPLRLSGPLGRAAQQHAEEISRRGTVRLPRGSTETMQQRIETAGYDAHEWAENVTSTTADTAALVREWRDEDPASFRRLMDPAYRDLGIGLARLDRTPLYVFLYAVPQEDYFARATSNLRDVERVRAEMLARVNTVRRRAGVAALRSDRTLDRAAQAHAEDMLARAYFAHKNPEGASVRERSRARGYAWRKVGENIAEGQLSVEEVVDTWMGSPGHRRNLLDPDFTELGVGLALGRSGGRYRTIWVQNFGRPR